MSAKGPDPICFICERRDRILKLHGEGTDAYWLCQPCEDTADSLLCEDNAARLTEAARLNKKEESDEKGN